MRSNRRQFLQLAGALCAHALLCAHSPYGQWMMYRKIRLIILTSRADERNWTTGEVLANLLLTHLPSSRATYARAREFTDIVRLLNSKQHDMALVRDIDAQEGLAGTGRFAEDGPTPLRALARVGPYLLVCRDDFQANHAYLIVEALAQNWSAFPGGMVDAQRGPELANPAIPLHPGAAEFYAGAVQPAQAR